MTGFEPATPSSQARCATKLRYIPIIYSIFKLFRRSLGILCETAPSSLRSPFACPIQKVINLFHGRPCYIPIIYSIFKLFRRSLGILCETAPSSLRSPFSWILLHSGKSLICFRLHSLMPSLPRAFACASHSVKSAACPIQKVINLFHGRPCYIPIIYSIFKLFCFTLRNFRLSNSRSDTFELKLRSCAFLWFNYQATRISYHIKKYIQV